MKRRVFVTGVAGLLAAPLAAEAQAGKPMRWSSVSCCWGWPSVFGGTRCASPTLRRPDEDHVLK